MAVDLELIHLDDGVATEKTTAVVLRAVDFSETSKVLTLFTRDFGKMKVLAKGGRRLKSNFEVALDLLSVCSISAIRKPAAELDLLTEALLVERFSGLRQDWPALNAAYYVAEVVDGLTQTGDPHAALFEETLRTLRRLAQGADRLTTLATFQLRLLDEVGYLPGIESCVVCGGTVRLSKRVPIGVDAGGLLCDACARTSTDRIIVQGETIQVIRTLLRIEDAVIDRMVLSEQARRELWQTTSSFVVHLLGKLPRTSAMLKL